MRLGPKDFVSKFFLILFRYAKLFFLRAEVLHISSKHFIQSVIKMSEATIWWDSEKLYHVKRPSNIPITHSFFTQGVLSIPSRRLEVFYSKLKADAQKTYPKSTLPVYHPLSEVVLIPPGCDNTTLINIFAEFDAPSNEEYWNNDYVIDIAKVFNQVLVDHRGSDGRHFVYVSRKFDLEDPNTKHSSIHLQTQIRVTVAELIKFTFYFLYELKRLLHRDSDMDPWETVLDLQVVQANKVNLRMNYMVKTKDCECTKIEKISTHCPLCQKGKQLVHQIYKCTSVLNETGELDSEEFWRVHDDIIEEWKATTIRPLEGSIHDKNYSIPAGSPESFPIKITTNQYGQKELNKSSKKFVSADLSKIKSWGQANELRQCQQWNSIKEVLSSNAKYQYWKRSSINRILWRQDPQTNCREYLVSLSGIGSNCCLNRIPGPNGFPAHKSMNRAYFIFGINGWRQRCHAGKKTANRVVRENGLIIPCQSFVSELVPFAEKHKFILFGIAESKLPSITSNQPTNNETEMKQSQEESVDELQMDDQATLQLMIQKMKAATQVNEEKEDEKKTKKRKKGIWQEYFKEEDGGQRSKVNLDDLPDRSPDILNNRLMSVIQAIPDFDMIGFCNNNNNVSSARKEHKFVFHSPS